MTNVIFELNIDLSSFVETTLRPFERMALVLFQSAELARSPRIAHESLINFAREPDRVPKACIVGARACRQSSGVTSA